MTRENAPVMIYIIVGSLTLFMAMSFTGAVAARIFGANDEIISMFLAAAMVSVIIYEGFGLFADTDNKKRL